VCPEHITITDNAIIPLKEREADHYWDPLGGLIRRVRERRARRGAAKSAAL
jgi:succinate dehydrogenase / fumarate reductase iron-sulfur subunit